MGCSSGPDIIEDGIALCFDAANKRSYAGSGGTLNDLNREDTAIAANGAVFDEDGGGCFSFDGTNDYMYISNSNYGSASTNGTISELTLLCWIKTGFTGSNSSDGGYTQSNWAWICFDRSEVFIFYPDDGGQIKFAGESSNAGGFTTYYDLGGGTDSSKLINDNQWHQVGVTFSVLNQKINFYKDGVQIRSLSSNGNMTALGAGAKRYGIIGDGSEASSANGSRNDIHYQGKIATILMYDSKALTADEVRQNYLSTKERFA
jgi:hypothetical protein